MNRLGQVAYEAYGDSREWHTVSGHRMPEWHEQDADLQEAWDASAQAVLDEVGYVMAKPEQLTFYFSDGRMGCDAPRVEGVLDNGLPERNE